MLLPCILGAKTPKGKKPIRKKAPAKIKVESGAASLSTPSSLFGAGADSEMKVEIKEEDEEAMEEDQGFAVGLVSLEILVMESYLFILVLKRLPIVDLALYKHTSMIMLKIIHVLTESCCFCYRHAFSDFAHFFSAIREFIKEDPEGKCATTTVRLSVKI